MSGQLIIRTSKGTIIRNLDNSFFRKPKRPFETVTNVYGQIEKRGLDAVSKAKQICWDVAAANHSIYRSHQLINPDGKLISSHDQTAVHHATK